MHISEFFCGVIATILFEISLCIILSVVLSIAGEKGGESDAEESDTVNTSTYDRNSE